MHNKSKGKRKTLANTLNIVAWVAFAVAVMLVVATVFASLSDKKNGQKVFGVKMYIVRTNSMAKPDDGRQEQIYFNAGDVILISEIDDVYALKENDVIAFISVNRESYGQTVTHKIKEVKYATSGRLIGYVTYGVKTGEVDETLVKPENILGVYTGKIPVVGHVFAFLKMPSGYFTAIILPCSLLIIYFSVKIGWIFGKKDCEKELKEYQKKLLEKQ